MKEGNFMKILIGIGLIIADKIHNDRMPDNLSPRDEWRWRNGGID